MREYNTSRRKQAYSALCIILCVVVMFSTIPAGVTAQASNNTTLQCAAGPTIYNEDTQGESGELEVVLANDVSNSMRDGTRLEDMKSGSKILVNNLEGEQEGSLVSFGGSVVLEESLTTNYTELSNEVDNLQADSNVQGTDVAGAVELSQNELLNGTNATEGSNKVMVVFGDGGAADQTAAIEQAEEAKQAGITIVTISLSNEDLYRNMASSNETAYFSPNESDLESIYTEVTEQVGEIGSEKLVVETRSLYLPGETHGYEVYKLNNTGDETVRTYMTDTATITTTDNSILSVNQGDNTLTATNSENTSEWVRVDAQASGLTGCTNVVVSQPTVSNLDLIPTAVTRMRALFTDPTFFALLIAGLVAVPAARFSSAFGGLAAAEMVIVIGWLSGYIGIGIAMLSVFTAIFIGLNLAENTNIETGIR